MKIRFLRITGARFFLFLSAFALFLGFFTNFWRVAEPLWFHDFQSAWQGFIIGRMVQSEQNGLFSQAALDGLGGPDPAPPDIEHPNHGYQYQAYLEGLTFQSFSVYPSRIGADGLCFSILNQILPFSPGDKLEIFHAIESLLLTLVLAYILFWFYREVSPIAAWIALLSTLMSQWLTVFGRNLWWSTWAFYLPMAAMIFLLSRRSAAEARIHIWLGILAFGAVLVKCLFNGYEYIPTVLIMMTIPYLYHAVISKIPIRKLLAGIFAAVTGSAGAVLASLTILALQLSSIEGGLGQAITQIIFSLEKRTYADPRSFPPDYTAGLTSSLPSILATYAKGIWFDFNNYLTSSNSIIHKLVFQIRFGELIALFGVATVLLVLAPRFFSNDSRMPEKSLALNLAAWASLLAPLSFFIIFKAHSYVHTQIDFLVWQMPFTLFGFALCGWTAQTYFLGLRNQLRPRRGITASAT